MDNLQQMLGALGGGNHGPDLEAQRGGVGGGNVPAPPWQNSAWGQKMENNPRFNQLFGGMLGGQGMMGGQPPSGVMPMRSPEPMTPPQLGGGAPPVMQPGGPGGQLVGMPPAGPAPGTTFNQTPQMPGQMPQPGVAPKWGPVPTSGGGRLMA